MYYPYLWNRDEKTDHQDDDTQQVHEGIGELRNTLQLLEHSKVPITDFFVYLQYKIVSLRLSSMYQKYLLKQPFPLEKTR